VTRSYQPQFIVESGLLYHKFHLETESLIGYERLASVQNNFRTVGRNFELQIVKGPVVFGESQYGVGIPLVVPQTPSCMTIRRVAYHTEKKTLAHSGHVDGTLVHPEGLTSCAAMAGYFKMQCLVF